MEWTPDPITRLVWEVNIRSIQDGESFKTWVDSWINCFKPNWDFIALIFEPSYVSILSLYQLDDFSTEVTKDDY